MEISSRLVVKAIACKIAYERVQELVESVGDLVAFREALEQMESDANELAQRRGQGSDYYAEQAKVFRAAQEWK